MTLPAENSDRPDLTGQDWTPEENSAICADYFSMLHAELAGAPYNKSEHRRILQPHLRGRSEQSIEFKHCNISAFLRDLRHPYIAGYKPRANKQTALAAAVEELLSETPQITKAALASARVDPPALPQAAGTFTEVLVPVPEVEPSVERPWTRRRGRRIDFVKRDAVNRRLGRFGEQWAFELEQRRLRDAGRDDLAARVSIISETEGDGAGFDILSYEATDERERWIEVKATGWDKYFPFYLSSNEVRCSAANADRYQLYRVFDFADRPRLYVLPGDLSQSCVLSPSLYAATVRPNEGRL
jgi:hypothetical protein